MTFKEEQANKECKKYITCESCSHKYKTFAGYECKNFDFIPVKNRVFNGEKI
jgi:hypothetical protein